MPAYKLIGPCSVYIGSGILAFGAVCYPAIATIKVGTALTTVILSIAKLRRGILRYTTTSYEVQLRGANVCHPAAVATKSSKCPPDEQGVKAATAGSDMRQAWSKWIVPSMVERDARPRQGGCSAR